MNADELTAEISWRLVLAQNPTCPRPTGGFPAAVAS